MLCVYKTAWHRIQYKMHICDTLIFIQNVGCIVYAFAHMHMHSFVYPYGTSSKEEKKELTQIITLCACYLDAIWNVKYVNFVCDFIWDICVDDIVLNPTEIVEQKSASASSSNDLIRIITSKRNETQHYDDISALRVKQSNFNFLCMFDFISLQLPVRSPYFFFSFHISFLHQMQPILFFLFGFSRIFIKLSLLVSLKIWCGHAARFILSSI